MEDEVLVTEVSTGLRIARIKGVCSLIHSWTVEKLELI
jgi:hypothetical protein